MNKVHKPIGLESAVREIERLCEYGLPYESSRIDPMLIDLGAGDGQTTFTRYAARMLMKHKIRQIVGLTTYLEFTVTPRKGQMRIMFGDIESAAKGVNHFEGVIAMDVTALCECVREEQTGYFLDCLRDIAKHAVVILYLSPVKSKNQARYAELKEKLQKNLIGLRTIAVEPYTTGELTRMVLAKLDDYGIELEGNLNEKLEQVVAESCLSCARDTEAIAETLARHARSDRFSAVLDLEALEKAFPKICSKGVTL
ncbi:MAG: hypothetical protein IKJ99_06115 [Oscillospiraceae bacterium]|nr:hypothetical protein [Oscillospiraceae bacterium]